MRDSSVVRLIDDQLFWYPPGRGAEPVNLEDADQHAQLREILQARRSPVIFAVPGSQLRLQQVSINPSERRHIASSLPYMLEEEYASDIEDLHIASFPLQPDQLAVAGSKRGCITGWQNRLADLPGINQWIPEPLLLPWREGEVTLVIETGQVVARHGESEGFAVEVAMLPMMLRAIDDSHKASIIVYGFDQGSDVSAVAEELRERVQWRNGGFSAALLLSEEGKQALNLLQGEFAAKLPLKRWWKLWRWPALALAAAFSVQLIATYVDYSQLKAENLRLRQAMESAYREAVPRGAIADPERQLRRKLNDIRGVGEAVAFVSLIERVGKVVQAQPNSQITTINFSGRSGDLRLNLLLPDFKVVEQVRSELNKVGLKASVESSNAQGDAVRARIKIKAGAT